MISVFNGFSYIKHANIIVSYFIRYRDGFKLTYTIPGRSEHFAQYFESSDPYDCVSYMSINGKKYDCDNMEKYFDRILTLLSQESNLRAIVALP